MEFGRNIVPNGKVECVVDGKPIEFNIDKRLVCAESTGILTLHPELFNKKEYDAAVVDCKFRLTGMSISLQTV